MKNLITASACVAILMAFLVQFVHMQVVYQQIVMTSHLVDLYHENDDEEWLRAEVSQIMGCDSAEVKIVDTSGGYQVRFPVQNYIATPEFWGIEDDGNQHIYVIERKVDEKGG